VKIAFLFAGQGCQQYHMGRGLRAADPVYRQWMERGDQRYRRRTGQSLLDRIYDRSRRPGDPFDELRLTHPAIFIAQYAAAQSLIAAGIRPTHLLGASLGELTTWTLAGLLDYDEALELVMSQVELVAACCPRGVMLTISASSADVAELLDDTQAEIAAVNTPAQLVVSAAPDDAQRIERRCQERGVVALRLPVHYPFHSRHIDGLHEPWLARLARVSIGHTHLRLFSSLTTTTLERFDRRHFWEVARGPIQLGATLANLARAGVEHFVDVGPGAVMATALKYAVRPPPGQSHALFSPFDPDYHQHARIVERLANESARPAARVA
jgi:acyl transferase domain-containing protein